MGTLRVRRQAPMMTGVGKIMTLHRLQAGQVIEAPE
jgi:hypothetical protein